MGRRAASSQDWSTQGGRLAGGARGSAAGCGAVAVEEGAGVEVPRGPKRDAVRGGPPLPVEPPQQLDLVETALGAKGCVPRLRRQRAAVPRRQDRRDGFA
jgi:hypothetical protein